MSLWYPSNSAPTSMTTVWPSSITVSSGLVVRQRGVDRARGDDRVVARPARAQLAHPGVEAVAELGLGGPFEQHRQGVGERGVGDLARPAHAGDLPRILHPPALLHRARARHQLGGGTPRSTAGAGRRVTCGVLEADPVERGERRRPARRAPQPACVPTRTVPCTPCAGELRRGLLAVAAVGDEHDLVGREDRPPVGSGEPAQPADVAEVGHEQRRRRCVARRPGSTAPGPARAATCSGSITCRLHGGCAHVPSLLATASIASS